MNAIAALVMSCCAAAMLANVAHAAQKDVAADYPNKPIRLIVPYSAGGATDISARVIGAKLTDRWGQQVVVDNRTGAGGAIAVEYTANATPDGHTICLLSASQATASATGQKFSYDLLGDLQPIAQAISVFYVVYHPPALPVTSVAEVIAFAKANPGKINYGTSGVGSLQHFAGELLSRMTGVKLVKVPYKGAANITQAMVANEVQLATGKLIGEGFDHPPLDTLVLAMPVSWKGTLQQYAGRMHREHAGKTDVRIIDFVDTGHPALLRMRDKRQRGYRAMGYRITELAREQLKLESAHS